MLDLLNTELLLFLIILCKFLFLNILHLIKIFDYSSITHHKDPVPHVPTLLEGFRRIPTEIWYENPQGLDYKWCPATPGHEV